MAYAKRITDAEFPANYVDGSILLHTDMNKIEQLTKDGINANYEAIQKLEDGTTVINRATNSTNADNASALSGAVLSKKVDEDLQNNDEKVPTSKQVKEYVDGAISGISMDYPDLTNKPSINGHVLVGDKTSSDLGIDIPIYYFDGTNTAANVAMFNEICGKFDRGEKFLLVGKVNLENGYTSGGVFYDRELPVLVPISVKNFAQYEEGQTIYSFMTDPVYMLEGYAVGSVKAVGTWGNFTSLAGITWGYNEGPAKKGDLATVAFSGSYNDLTNKPTIFNNDTDGQVDTIGVYGGSSKYLKNLSYVYHGAIDETKIVANSDDITIEEIQVDGTTVMPSNKVVNITGKQDTLVSGTNIKTINNESILGSGNITIQSGSDSAPMKYLGDITDYNTSVKALDLNSLKKGTCYIHKPLDGYDYTFYFKAITGAELVTDINNVSILSGKYDGGSIFINILKEIEDPTLSNGDIIGYVYYISYLDSGAQKQGLYEIAYRGNHVVLTDYSVSRTTVNTSGNQTISGTKTFSNVPVCSAVASSNNDLVNKYYVDNAIAQVGGGSVSVIDANGVTADNLAILQDFYANYLDDKEASLFVKDIENNKSCELYFAATDGSTYIDFEGMYVSASGSSNYGVNYAILKKCWIRLTLSSGDVASYDLYNNVAFGYMPTSPSQILGISNTSSYDPVDDYNPATKKYVDDHGPAIVVLTEAEYNALSTYEDDTEYHIIEG